MEPIVSFVVPCYNYGRYVAQAVDSLLAQTVREIEVIVIDDASTDETPAVLARYRDEPRVTLIRHETNKRNVPTFNEGLQLAGGRYIGLLSADDYAERDDAVAQQVAWFERYPNAAAVYGSYLFVDAAGQLIGPSTEARKASAVYEGKGEFERLLWQNYIPHSGTLVRRSCHQEIGWYDERYPHANDWDFFFRLLSRYDIAHIAEPLYAYRMHDANMNHHAVTPRQAIDEYLAVLDENFARLPAPDQARLAAVHRASRTQTLLKHVWSDLWWGRARRAWAGIGAAARTSPGVVVRKAFGTTLVRAVCLTLVGRNRYRRMFARFDA